MKHFLPNSMLLLLILISSLSAAAERSIILSVPGMNCPSCPYMVEQSLAAVEGVRTANADLASRTAEIIFDDAIASIDDMLGATAAIGYESSILTGSGDQ